MYDVTVQLPSVGRVARTANNRYIIYGGRFRYLPGVAMLAQYIHCGAKKTWQYIRNHNSGKPRSIFIILALIEEARRNVLHTHEKYVHLT